MSPLSGCGAAQVVKGWLPLSIAFALAIGQTQRDGFSQSDKVVIRKPLEQRQLVATQERIRGIQQYFDVL
jgi:hypothetical protein